MKTIKYISIKTLFTGLLLAFTFSAQAQNQMVVELISGDTDSYLVPDIRSIKFGDATMIIYRNTAAPVTYTIADIAQYSFVDVTSAGSANAGNKNTLSIFPNPAADQVDVVYTNTSEERISIELLDATGRILGVIFNGMHQGKQAYKHALSLPSGVYFCRIVAEEGTLTKPFAVH
jgi:hypothetical protein